MANSYDGLGNEARQSAFVNYNAGQLRQALGLLFCGVARHQHDWDVHCVPGQPLKRRCRSCGSEQFWVEPFAPDREGEWW